MNEYTFKPIMTDAVDFISEMPQSISITPFRRLLSQVGYHEDGEEDASVTPLHTAAKEGDCVLVKQLIEEGADVRARTLTDNQTPFHIAVRNGKIEVVEYFLDLDKSFLEDQDSLKLTPLHLAVASDHADVVELLIQRGADLNARTCLWLGRLTPIEVAAREGAVKALECLLIKGGSLGEELGQRQSLLHLSCQFGHIDSVTLLLKSGADPHLANNQGLTSIDLAIDNGHRKVVLKLLESEKWVKLMTHAYLENGVLVTPMRKLIRDMPDVAEKVFDKCVESGETVKAYSYELLEDRSVILDWVVEGKAHASDIERYLNNRFKVRDNHPLSIMVEGQEEKLLAHPLVTSLLSRKWKGLARYFYYAHLLLHITFLVFMTSFALTVPSPYEGLSLALNDSTTLSEMNMSCSDQEKTEKTELADEKMFASSCSVICLSIIAFNTLIEVLRMYRSRLSYFTLERTPKWVLLISGSIFLLPVPCSFYKEPWQWSTGIIAIFFAWLEFTLSLRRLDIIGIYIVMFVHTLATSFKVVCALLGLMVGFAISFYMSLSNHPPFTTIVKSLFKSTMWMTGEFEYDSVFNEQEAAQIYYPVSTYILFILFIIFMTILFMNLLISLALTVEAMLPLALTKKIYYFGSIEVKEPGKLKPKRADIKAVMDQQDKIHEGIGQSFDKTEKLAEKQEKLEGLVTELAAQTVHLQKMMAKLLEHNGLSSCTETDV
ncbi:transient receptor potential cation channel subfamily A member 1 homolog isoform X2 [Watersipora subatra]|uniref:transient receptor potential cation channel subfamily A member 1 homolog isoform X2 n=1 Tax=Watersipora subatra TaxID=2589382 RepID=UPI00355B8262